MTKFRENNYIKKFIERLKANEVKGRNEKK